MEFIYGFADFLITSEIELPELEAARVPDDIGQSRLFIRPSAENSSCILGIEQIHEWAPDDGGMRLERITSRHALRLQFPGLAEFTCLKQGHLIEVRKFQQANPETLRHLLLDQVLPRILAHLGETVLHAAAVRVGGNIIGFTGASGVGKSTLSAAFAADGAELLSDDGIVLSAERGIFSAVPTYPSLRLWPETLMGLYEQRPTVAPMAHYSTKQRVLPLNPLATTAPIPVAALYVLATGEMQEVKIVRLSPRASCMAIVSNCFQLDVTDTNRAALIFHAASEIAQHVPVFSLGFPRDFARLAEVKNAILGQQGMWAHGTAGAPIQAETALALAW